MLLHIIHSWIMSRNREIYCTCIFMLEPPLQPPAVIRDEMATSKRYHNSIVLRSPDLLIDC